MRAHLRFVFAFLALLGVTACSLAVPFDEEAQPCSINDECIDGFVCKHDARDAGTCVRGPG